MPSGNKKMLTFNGKSHHDYHVICALDGDREYVYEVELCPTLREIAKAHRCHTRRAYKMLKKASMELPVRGDRANYWME